MSSNGMRRGTRAVLTGAGIGLVNVFAFATAKRGIGVSNAFESAAALAGRKLAPDALAVNDYVEAADDAPAIGWEHWLVLGTVLGSLLSNKAADGDHRVAQNTSPAAAFAGGALVMAGARMAGGCTSGHCLTGTAQRAGSSWTFTPVMFATAALTEQIRRRAAR